MKKDFASIIMDPTRMRIIQYLITQELATATQMKNYLEDVPQATLYRHLKVLEENECILVAEEKRVRGTIEKTYRLNPAPFGTNPDSKEINQMIQMTLLQIMGAFTKYFEQEKIDMQKDMYAMTSCNLLLSDEEFLQFNEELGKVFTAVVGNKPQKGRKSRRITFINSPIEESEL